MPFTTQKSTLCAVVLFSLSFAPPLFAAKLSVSTEVQANIKLLSESKSCPQCNLSGAILNRFDLSGANLEGADLSRAKFYLSNLSGANLRNANLKEAEFGGADLAGADLTGADLTGASLVGAYIVGAKLDGEMVSTKPYVDDDISEVEEDVYVEDTVKPKSMPATEDITIGSRRDFEETSPVVELETEKPKVNQEEVETPVVEEVTEIVEEQQDIDTGVPEVSLAAPKAKSAPAMNSVLIEEVEAPAKMIEKKTVEPVEPSVTVEEDDTPEAVETVVIAKEVVTQPEPEVTPEEVVTEKENSLADEVVAQKSTDAETPVEGVEESKAVENTETSPTEGLDQIAKEAAVAVLESVVVAPEAEPAVDKVVLNVEQLLESKSCYSCDLSGANLSGEDLDSADLEGADLSNANLTGADLEGANLKGANLSNADLSGADLSGADFYKADLSNANLSGAKLEKVLLDDAKMTGVQGYQQQLLLMEAN